MSRTAEVHCRSVGVELDDDGVDLLAFEKRQRPGEGIWDAGDSKERDDIVLVEVMTNELDERYWHDFRRRLETELSQDVIVIRAQEIIRL